MFTNIDSSLQQEQALALDCYYIEINIQPIRPLWVGIVILQAYNGYGVVLNTGTNWLNVCSILVCKYIW